MTKKQNDMANSVKLTKEELNQISKEIGRVMDQIEFEDSQYEYSGNNELYFDNGNTFTFGISFRKFNESKCDGDYWTEGYHDFDVSFEIDDIFLFDEEGAELELDSSTAKDLEEISAY